MTNPGHRNRWSFSFVGLVPSKLEQPLVPVPNYAARRIPSSQQNWNSHQQPPQNLVSRKPCRGINILLLHSMGYASSYWLTFRQAQKAADYILSGNEEITLAE